MDIGEYVVARHPMLVRAAVLMGRPLERARSLVEEALGERARAIRRSDDPDPEVLRTLHAAVETDRIGHPAEAVPQERPDQPPGLDDEGLAVRHALGAMPAEVRDAAVLLWFCDLTAADAADALGLERRDLPPRAAAALAALGVTEGDDARQLLAQAGDTILVRPAGPLPTRPPRGSRGRAWLLPTVAAAAALAVLTGIALQLQGDPPGRPDAKAAQADPLPLTLRGNQLPSFFGYRVGDATARLEAYVLRVDVTRVEACEPPGLVLGTNPGIGTSFQPGDTVELVVPRVDPSSCGDDYPARVESWAFLDFATGRGAPPRFAREVTVSVDGGLPVRLSRREARDPSLWGNALSRVADAAGRIGVDDGHYLGPTLVVMDGVPPAEACGVRRPDDLGRRTAVELAITLATESGGCPLTVDLYRRGGAVDTVVVRSPRPQGSDSAGSP
ncbi:PASTA domain-containing protein [Nocardioides sp. KIGAM211]|uniref:PASTA domain-containing protein n=1 Tax=Nocardioides luti TaxID=2761101 RepID=A0A7X0VBD1_9ACTN|nr:PASTA domain-containing protein [Nocardioides luti]MBB6628290.1 PASTA domain-containing protein [Nocardioides luti]